MRKILFILAGILGTCSADALAQTASPMNTEYDKHFDGLKGRFAYQVKPGEEMQVSYKLTPMSPEKNAHFVLHTPDAMPLHATISNAKGKEVYSWKPQQMVYLYESDWDLSGLKAGEYTVNLFMGTDKSSIYHFSFTKK